MGAYHQSVRGANRLSTSPMTCLLTLSGGLLQVHALAEMM
jgi:hypothetical protein